MFPRSIMIAYVLLKISRVESKVAGFFVFSFIQMMGYFRLGKLRFKVYPARFEIREKLL